MAVFLQLAGPDRTKALAAILESPAGGAFRLEVSRWVAQALSVERLVPEAYAEWRPLVYDAMVFFGSHLSTARLAPKLVEQIELPPDTLPERRLSRLIARVPGLQKLGQVIAKNRHLHRSLRRELTQLENGIRDVTAEEIRSIIVQNLGPNLERYAVKISPKIFCEASQCCDAIHVVQPGAATAGTRRFQGHEAVRPRLFCRGHGLTCAAR